MDNKITKSRLQNLFSYKWIMILVIVALSIAALTIAYGAIGEKLSVGQRFFFYYDAETSAYNSDTLRKIVDDAKTFSFDVLEQNYEKIEGTNSVFSARMSLAEGDSMVSSIKPTWNEKAEYDTRRINEVIDNFFCFSFEDRTSTSSVLYGAEKYLKTFLADGKEGEDAFVYENLDEKKIEQRFNERLKNDNRYKRGLLKVEDEYARIQKLCVDAAFIERIIAYNEEEVEKGNPSLFYDYHKYEQAYKTEEYEPDKKGYEEKYKKEITRPYGIKPEMLTGGKVDPSKCFKLVGESGAEDTVLVFFNFEYAKADLQYEDVSFMATIFRTFSDLGDKV